MKVKTKDFQILKGEHEFEFPVGITVIQGKTGSGKTTLFYAIEDCLINPNGVDDAINWDAKEASVTIENNGNKITWTKTKTSSEYKNELTGQQFVKASKIDSTTLGDLGFYIKDGDVINIQDEWKILFPFGLKDTEMFRLFEDIFNISCSFAVIDDYKKDEKEVKSQINQTLEQLNSFIQTNNSIEDMLSKVDVSKVDNIINKLTNKKLELSQLNEDLASLSNNNKYKEVNLPARYDSSNLINMESYRNQIIKDYDNYCVNNQLKNSKLPKKKQFDIKINPYKEDYNNYLFQLNEIKRFNNEKSQLDIQYNELEKKLAEIKVCPTCGRPL